MAKRASTHAELDILTRRQRAKCTHEKANGSVAREGCLAVARLEAMPMKTGLRNVTAIVIALLISE